MATLDQKIHIKQGNTIQEVTLYTTTEEASVYGAYGTARYNNADCYYALGTGADTNTGSAYITPLRVIKNNIIYYILTEGQNSEAAVVTKTRRYIGGYAENNVANYQTVTTLPQTNIEYLTNIEPLADASFVFNNCSNLTSLSGVEQTWNTSNVTDMHYMFYNCQALTSVDVSNWNTSKVKTINKMFQNCTALTSLDLSNFDTSNVTNMQSMFYNCNHLISLDLSNWDTSKVSSMSYMFYNCQALQYLVIDSSTVKFELLEDTYLNNTCKILVPQALIPTYQAATNWSNYASQFDAIENYTITRSNGQVTVKATAAALQTFTLTLAGTLHQTITLTYSPDADMIVTRTISSTDVDQEITMYYGYVWEATITADTGYSAGTLSASSGTVTAAITVSATAAKAIIVLTDSYYKMSDVYPNTYRSMTEVPDILDSSNITTTEEMFRGCTALTVSPELDTVNVGNMNRMFYECTNLTTVSQMDTSNVNYMSWMFYNCSSLPEEFSWAIDFDGIHDSSVENMFKGSSVTSVTLANVNNIVKSTYITSERLKRDNTLTISFVNIPNYHIGSIYPDTYRSITSVDINTIKTQYPGILDNLTSVAQMFYNCVGLTTISNINQLDISKVTSMKSMFHLCRALTSIPQLDTSNVTNMESMFNTCNALTSIPQLDTSNVTNMAYMFFDCQSLPATFPWTIDCSSITDAYNMNGMFVYSPVTSVTLSNVNSSIRSGVTPERLKDSSLTITFV